MIQAELLLEHLMAAYKPGDEWSWESEFDFLEEVHGQYMDELALSIQEHGVLTPIHLGYDGRVWDGHHRLYAAYQLGIPEVPVIIEMRDA